LSRRGVELEQPWQAVEASGGDQELVSINDGQSQRSDLKWGLTAKSLALGAVYLAYGRPPAGMSA
jgi:hypothetical protein